MLSVVNDADGSTANGSSLIDEIVRESARRMLAAALEAEVNEVNAYITEWLMSATSVAVAWWYATATTNPGRSPPRPA